MRARLLYKLGTDLTFSGLSASRSRVPRACARSETKAARKAATTQTPKPPVHLFVDETGCDDKSRFFAVGCVILDDPKLVTDEVDALRETLLSDPFIALHGKARRELERNGFHYRGDHQEVRARFIELLMGLTFEAYLCFVEKPRTFESAAWYDRLFGRLLFERLRDNRNRTVRICYEQGDSKRHRRLAGVKQIVDSCVRAIGRDRGGPPEPPTVRSAGKEESCLAVSDYVCGIVRTYLEERHDRSKTYPKVNFARIRPKVRVIHDVGNEVFYTRRNPLP